jgi:hypothetical protein
VQWGWGGRGGDLMDGCEDLTLIGHGKLRSCSAATGSVDQLSKQFNH